MQTLTPMTVDRRALHRIPELGDELPKTMDYVQEVLGTLGCEVFFPLDSAVCAYFDFGAADTLAFRAEMDALPIAERTGLPFASLHSGRMHACGHDGHMAMALELGRRLCAKENLPHNVLLVFQPAEETTGGARRICETGLFERQSRICPAPLAGSFCRDDRRFARRHDGALGRGDVHRRGALRTFLLRRLRP